MLPTASGSMLPAASGCSVVSGCEVAAVASCSEVAELREGELFGLVVGGGGAGLRRWCLGGLAGAVGYKMSVLQ